MGQIKTTYNIFRAHLHSCFISVDQKLLPGSMNGFGEEMEGNGGVVGQVGKEHSTQVVTQMETSAEYLLHFVWATLFGEDEMINGILQNLV